MQHYRRDLIRWFGRAAFCSRPALVSVDCVFRAGGKVACYPVVFGTMNGLGLRPLPAAISDTERPDATELSSCSNASVSSSPAKQLQCLISNQLTRLPLVRSCSMRTSTQLR